MISLDVEAVGRPRTGCSGELAMMLARAEIHAGFL